MLGLVLISGGVTKCTNSSTDDKLTPTRMTLVDFCINSTLSGLINFQQLSRQFSIFLARLQMESKRNALTDYN